MLGIFASICIGENNVCNTVVHYLHLVIVSDSANFVSLETFLLVTLEKLKWHRYCPWKYFFRSFPYINSIILLTYLKFSLNSFPIYILLDNCDRVKFFKMILLNY